MPIDLLDTGLSQGFNLFFKNEQNGNTYLRSAIKLVMPVYRCRIITLHTWNQYSTVCQIYFKFFFLKEM